MTSPTSLNDWLQLLETRHHKTIDLGLERVGLVWQALDCPRPAPRVFTVAGTNGKGSTVAYIDGMLAALSYRSGTYTSPHVFRYNERVRIAGAEVSDEDLVWSLAAVEEARNNVSLSYFEHGTLAAFLLMRRAELDFAVLEVGLGGRLDAVNLIDADCAVITPIGLDHQEYLGPDRETIGREKAGILRHGQVAISGEQQPPASVREHARELGVSLQRLGHEFHIGPTRQGLRWWSGNLELALPLPPLSGMHQFRNLAASVAAVLALLPEAGRKQSLLAKGIQAVRLPGRLQAHADDPRVLVDVGHNPLAAEAIAQQLQATGRKVRVCVLAMLRDKDAAAVARILDQHVESWYCAGLEGERGRSGQQLAQLVAESGVSGQVREFPRVDAALLAAHRELQAAEQALVFGSFLTATQALGTPLAGFRPGATN